MERIKPTTMNQPIKTDQLGTVWIANQGGMSAIGVSEEAAIQGVRDCAATQPTNLHPPETAPKNGTVILGDFGYPWLVPAAWNSYDERWAITIVQSSPLDGKDDTWFETEWETESALAGWMPMPEKP